jgi:hypothetical protein
MTGIEKRKHVRIPVSVAVSCISTDADGAQLNFNMGMVKDVSQGGMALEVIGEVRSDRMLLAFVDMHNNTQEINGKVVHFRKTTSGALRVGVTLLGTAAENIEFVKHLVRFHHYTKKLSGSI